MFVPAKQCSNGKQLLEFYGQQWAAMHSSIPPNCTKPNIGLVLSSPHEKEENYKSENPFQKYATMH